MTEQLPLTPYAGTSGWSGSDTSEDRARSEDQNGTTTRRQMNALRVIRLSGLDGCTWKEVAVKFGWHHGQASGVLSVLHKEGRIARLAETRNRCKVYVMPDCVNGRDTEPHASKKHHTCPNCGTTI